MLNQYKAVRDMIANFNTPNPLVDYLRPFIGDKKEVKILDIGSGPFSTIGHYLEGVTLDIHNADNQDFTKFYKKNQVTPIVPIEYQDMENLMYNWDFFDIVHCANALDHTKNALKAVYEMIRVCKPGGIVYIACNLYQMETGHKHYWNATEEGIFENNKGRFDLKELGFSMQIIDNGGEKRYNKIIAIKMK